MPVQVSVLGFEATDELPEAARMIHVARMAQFVDHEVAKQRRIQEQQAIIYTDRSRARVAPPARLLATDLHFLERIARLGCQRAQPGLQRLFRNGYEPSLQRRNAQLIVTGTAAQNQHDAMLILSERCRDQSAGVARSRIINNVKK